MLYDTIRYDVSEGIATLTLNRPEAMNALNVQMRAEIADAVRRAGAEARAVVLTGAGRAFCSGQDLGERADLGNIDLERTLRDEYLPMQQAIDDCRVPTLAAVNGAAAGAGATLALSCDVVIATESAVFQQPFARIGLIPDGGATFWLPRQIGFAKAMGAALFAAPIPARQADDWGMIWEAVPDRDFADRWRQSARQLAEGPTAAFAHIKTALRQGFANDLLTQFELEARLQGECGRTRDFQEGVVAFLEGRKPQFEGR